MTTRALRAAHLPGGGPASARGTPTGARTATRCPSSSLARSSLSVRENGVGDSGSEGGTHLQTSGGSSGDGGLGAV
ncbi:hypothetical protein NL676_038851 [Syzygium grande]|nr:hypothetical protein NL676_038851 [Syzygium grande]